MTVKYANVPLRFPSPAVMEAVERFTDPADVFQWPAQTWPGDEWSHWSLPASLVPRRPVRVGSLYWPVGANAFSVGYFLAQSDDLSTIYQSTIPSPSAGLLPATLEIRQVYPDPIIGEVDVISTSMFMLPARPLFQLLPTDLPEGREQLYLITLVDARYFWQFRNTGVITADGQTWEALYTSAAGALGDTITPDAIPAAYLVPGKGLNVDHAPAAAYLDNVAYSVGQRIVRALDGTLKGQSDDSARAQVDSNLLIGYPRKGGGEFLLDDTFILPGGSGTEDITSILPANVEVAFPSVEGDAIKEDRHIEQVTLESLALPEADGQTGFDGTKTFYADTAFESGTNDAEITALAQQIATDYYKSYLGKLDLTLHGIVNWEPEGFHGIEWRYADGEQQTRIQRGPFFDHVQLGFMGESSTVPTPTPGAGDAMPLCCQQPRPWIWLAQEEGDDEDRLDSSGHNNTFGFAEPFGPEDDYDLPLRIDAKVCFGGEYNVNVDPAEIQLLGLESANLNFQQSTQPLGVHPVTQAAVQDIMVAGWIWIDNRTDHGGTRRTILGAEPQDGSIPLVSFSYQDDFAHAEDGFVFKRDRLFFGLKINDTPGPGVVVEGVFADSFGSPPLQEWVFYVAWSEWVKSTGVTTLFIQINMGAIDSHVLRVTQPPNEGQSRAGINFYSAAWYGVGGLPGRSEPTAKAEVWQGRLDEIMLFADDQQATGIDGSEGLPTQEMITLLYESGKGRCQAFTPPAANVPLISYPKPMYEKVETQIFLKKFQP